MRLRLLSVAACVLGLALAAPGSADRSAALAGDSCAKVFAVAARGEAPRAVERSGATTLQVSESCSSAQNPPEIDARVTFIATIVNTGSTVARNVVATLTVPPTGGTVPRHPSTQCKPPEPNMVCSIGDLQPGLPFSVYFSVTPTVTGPLTSKVTVTSQSAATVSDQSSPVVRSRHVVRVLSVNVLRRSGKRFSVAGILSVDTPFPDCVGHMPIALLRVDRGVKIPLVLISTGPASNNLRAVAAARFAKVVTLLHPTGGILASAVPKTVGDLACQNAVASHPVPPRR